MVLKQITGFFFSPTGNTKAAVEELLKAFEERKEVIDLTGAGAGNQMMYGFTENEAVIVGAPVYAGRIPETAAERFQKLKGHNTPAIVLVTYGNRAYDDALLELCDVLRARGFLPFAAVAVPASHNIATKIAAGRPDAEDRKQLADFGKQIVKKAAELKASFYITELKVPGNRPYRPYHAAGLKIHVSKSCKECGTCIKECPVQAISRTDPRVMDAERCISCMRCVSVCPQGSRKLGLFVLMAIEKKLKKACAERKNPELFI